MCLAVPVKVAEILGDDLGLIEVDGVRKEISLALVEEVVPGDYVIVHVGHAIQRLDVEEAEKTLALFAQMIAAEKS